MPPRPRTVRPRARIRPIDIVKRTISENPHLEHAFIKRSRCQIEDVTKNNTKFSTSFDQHKSLKYLINTLDKDGVVYNIHTHPKTKLIDILPSVEDLIFASGPNIIYINENKRISGQVHFHVRSKFKKSFKSFQNKIEKAQDKLSEICEKQKLSIKQKRFFGSNISKTIVINELLSKAEGRRYLEKEKPILNHTKYDSEFMDFCVKYRFFNHAKINNFLKYQHLFHNNKSILQLYELLGIQLKFVANKHGGYKFDPNTIEFIRK